MSRLSQFTISLAFALLMAGCTTLPGARPVSGEHYSRALAAMTAADYEQAESLLTTLTEREPDHAGVWANLGIVWARQERESEAVQALERALDLNPDIAAAHNELGVLHRRAGRLALAETAYNRALAVDPEHAIAHRNIGVLYDLYLARPDQALDHYQRYIELADADAPVERWIAELVRRIPVREAHNQ